MAGFVFFIVTVFKIWACHVTCVYKLAKNFISRDALLNFRKEIWIETPHLWFCLKVIILTLFDMGA